LNALSAPHSSAEITTQKSRSLPQHPEGSSAEINNFTTTAAASPISQSSAPIHNDNFASSGKRSDGRMPSIRGNSRVPLRVL
jgi:hypothetical protein